MLQYDYHKKSKGNNKKSLLDENFDLEEAYFYRETSKNEWTQITKILTEYFEDGTASKEILDKLDVYKSLDKGEANVNTLKKM